MDDSRLLLSSLQDTLYLLTLDDYAPAHLLTALGGEARWQQTVLRVIEALAANGLATLEGAEGDWQATLRHLRDNGYRDGGDDLAWDSLLLSLTKKGMERVAELGIDALDLPPTTVIEELAKDWGLLAKVSPKGAADYPVSFRLPLPDGGALIVFESASPDGAVHREIVGRELFRFDSQSVQLWQINPEPGTTGARAHPFDRAVTTDEPFVTAFEAGGRYYASRWNGDTFLLDMAAGYAIFSGWART